MTVIYLWTSSCHPELLTKSCHSPIFFERRTFKINYESRLHDHELTQGSTLLQFDCLVLLGYYRRGFLFQKKKVSLGHVAVCVMRLIISLTLDSITGCCADFAPVCWKKAFYSARKNLIQRRGQWVEELDKNKWEKVDKRKQRGLLYIMGFRVKNLLPRRWKSHRFWEEKWCLGRSSKGGGGFFTRASDASGFSKRTNDGQAGAFCDFHGQRNPHNWAGRMTSLRHELLFK